MSDLLYLKASGARLTEAERIFLMRCAERTVDRFGPRAVIVNIGVQRGASLHCLRAGAPTARLIGIDIEYHRHGRTHLRGDPEAVLLCGNSNFMASILENRVHLVFVDGGHDYATVTGDIAAWTTRLVPGGMIVFHDYVPPPEAVEDTPVVVDVKRAIDDWVASRPGEWSGGAVLDSIIAFKKGVLR